MKSNALTSLRNGEKWTREEHVLAFNLYCKIPFGAIHAHNPKIIQLAKLVSQLDRGIQADIGPIPKLALPIIPPYQD